IFELHTEAESHFVENLFYLVERLPSEVLRTEHLCLGLHHEFADILNIRVFEAVRASYAQLDLFNATEEVLVKLFLRLFGDRLLFFNDKSFTNEKTKLIDENVSCLGNRRSRVDASVCPKLHGELIVVGALADPGVRDGVVHPPNRRENGVDENSAHGSAFNLVLVGSGVSASYLHGDLHLESCSLAEGSDTKMRIEDPDGRVSLHHPRRYFAWALHFENEARLFFVLKLRHHVFEIQHDLRD